MILALQVLLIHLIELNKVDELCKDFCSRYITTLKQQQETDNKLARMEMSDETLDVSPTTAMTSQENASASSESTNVVSGSGTVFQMIQTANGLVATPIQVPVCK